MVTFEASGMRCERNLSEGRGHWELRTAAGHNRGSNWGLGAKIRVNWVQVSPQPGTLDQTLQLVCLLLHSSTLLSLSLKRREDGGSVGVLGNSRGGPWFLSRE